MKFVCGLSLSMSATCFCESAGTACCCEEAVTPCKQHYHSVSDMDILLSLLFFFPSSRVQGATVTHLRGHVECKNRGGGEGGVAVAVEGCSEGEEVQSCPPVPGMCSQLAGKDVPGANSHVWLCSLHTRPSAFIHGLVLRAFSSSIVTQGLSKGFMLLTCAKHSG